MQNTVRDCAWVGRKSADPAKANVKKWRLGRIHYIQVEKDIAKGRTEQLDDLTKVCTTHSFF